MNKVLCAHRSALAKVMRHHEVPKNRVVELGEADVVIRLAHRIEFGSLRHILDRQVACFRNVATHLEPGGCFVIEVGVPGLQRLPPGETFHPFQVSETHLGIDEYDVANQGLISHHFRAIGGTFEKRSIPFRYVWPSELDLMAQVAGMALRERWSGWKREPFTSDSTKHISVWEKTALPSRG
jgi:hypothetical protein